MRLVLVLCLSCAVARAESPGPAVWGAVREPSAGPARSIGKYASGCISGAAKLPYKGEGFYVTRPERERVFGHPLLVSLVRALGAQVKKLKLGVLVVGDLGQPRGGPAPSGHASHQTGLDVDIWFLPLAGDKATSMIDQAAATVSRAFGSSQRRLLELAASDARVDRVFVHPLIKKALCDRSEGERAWLRKVRPWWGHHEHFHIRLSCPADSPECQGQEALPAGDGCEQIAWWLDAKAQAERDKERQTYQSRVGASPSLPEHCNELVAPAPVAQP
jgi:penicillin-insensitive murein endopeptidase